MGALFSRTRHTCVWGKSPNHSQAFDGQAPSSCAVPLFDMVNSMQTEMTFGARVADTWRVLVEHMAKLTEAELQSPSSTEEQKPTEAPTTGASG